MNRYIAASIFLTGISLSCAPVLAQNYPYGECRLGYWSSTRNLDNEKDVANTTCLLQWKASTSNDLRFGASARLQHGDASAVSNFSNRVREAYVHKDLGDLSIRLGRQVIAWGRSDRLSPTDVLSPRDFTTRVFDDEEQRNGADMATIRWQINPEWSITGVAARFEAHRIGVGLLPVNRFDLPTPTRAEYALRLDRTGEGVDTSLSIFDGFDKVARYSFQAIGAGGTFQSTHPRMQMVGADFATAVSRWTMRGEAAYFRYPSGCFGCSLQARTVQRVVLGGDRDFLESSNINMQVFSVRRSDFVDADNQPVTLRLLTEGLSRLNNEFASAERGVSIRLSQRYFNDALRAEVAGIFDLNHSSKLWRTRLSYSLNDKVKLQAGIDRFAGPQQSLFGSKMRNNLGFLELALVF
jgi:hypothetical protein